jgi:DNA polymerase-1
MLADRAKEKYMIDVYNRDGDIHTETAMRAFLINDPEKVDKTLHRAPCKNVNFAIVYGLQPEGLFDNMALTYAVAGQELPSWLGIPWCEKFIDDWFRLYPGVKKYMQDMHYRARRYGLVWDRFGRIKRIPEVWSCHERIRQAGLRQAGNMPIQAVSAGLMKLAMYLAQLALAELRSAGIWAWPLLTIHDELIIEVVREYADYVQEVVALCMDSVLRDVDTGVEQSLVRIKSDGRIGERWEK